MKNFLLAIRPKTLLAGFFPPIVSFFYAHLTHGSYETLMLTFCLIGALSIQIATNLFNDLIDFKKGADNERVGPVRVTTAGLVKPQTIKLWAFSFVGLAAVVGFPIIQRGGVPFLLLGLISLYLTYGYTGGKISLAYRGLGELFVFLFFGLFSTIGSYYLYTLSVDFKIIILGAVFGCLTTTFIMVNNLRDRETDLKVEKKTLATKLSDMQYRLLTIFSALAPYLLLHFFRETSGIYWIFLSLAPALKLAMIIYRESGERLNLGLKWSGIHLSLFSFILSYIFNQ